MKLTFSAYTQADMEAYRTFRKNNHPDVLYVPTQVNRNGRVRVDIFDRRPGASQLFLPHMLTTGYTAYPVPPTSTGISVTTPAKPSPKLGPAPVIAGSPKPAVAPSDPLEEADKPILIPAPIPAAPSPTPPFRSFF